MWGKVIKGLFKNTPLALVVIGVFLLVLGATGGFDKIGIKVDEAVWRVVLAVMGIVAGGFGVLEVLRGKGDIETSALAKECDLRITSPQKNSEVDEKVRLEGTYKKKPPRKSLAVLELSPSSGRYWFKRQPPVYDEKGKGWWSFTDIYVGGDKGEKRGEDRILYIAILGESGKALMDFYLAVREQFGKPAGIETLSPDIVLWDQVSIHRKPASPAAKPQ